jgi:hypothetical protein
LQGLAARRAGRERIAWNSRRHFLREIPAFLPGGILQEPLPLKQEDRFKRSKKEE